MYNTEQLCDIDLFQKCRSGQTVSEQRNRSPQQNTVEHNPTTEQSNRTGQQNRPPRAAHHPLSLLGLNLPGPSPANTTSLLRRSIPSCPNQSDYPRLPAILTPNTGHSRRALFLTNQCSALILQWC